METWKRSLRCLNAIPELNAIIVFSTLVASLMLWAFMQETIMTRPFGEDSYFRYPLFLVAVNRGASCLAAASALLLKKQSLSPIIPLRAIAIGSISNVLGTTCQYEALTYVSYPFQTIAKTLKTPPVMLVGSCALRRRYSFGHWLIALIVTGGVILFVLTGDVSSAVNQNKTQTGTESTTYGALLMAIYLACDGFTSSWQERNFRKYSEHQHTETGSPESERWPHLLSVSAMFWTTAFSCGVSSLSLLVSGKTLDALVFIASYPSIASFMLLMICGSVVSQFAIFYAIQEFGAFGFALMMTIRQLLTIMLSAYAYEHRIEPLQWLAVAIVFGPLLFKPALKNAAFQKILSSNANNEVKGQGGIINI